MTEKYKVVYLTQKVQITDPQFGVVVDKVVKFPSFQSAVTFARTVRTTETDRLLGKPLVEEV